MVLMSRLLGMRHVCPNRRTVVYIYILDAVPPIHIVSSHVAIDKLTTANGKMFTSSSASLSSQSR